MGKALEEWSYGDLDAGFAAAALVLDETFVVQSTGHHPMETRSAMAYWQNGKLFIHASTQSLAQTRDNIARWVGIEPSEVMLISEYTGGGFGSKGGGAVSMSIPALLSRKTNAPVMMRITPRGGKLYRPLAHEHDRPCPRRLCEGRSHHGARSLHRRRIPARTGRSAITVRPASRRR